MPNPKLPSSTMALRRALSNHLKQSNKYVKDQGEPEPATQNFKDDRSQSFSQAIKNASNDYMRPRIWVDVPRTSIKPRQAIALVRVLSLEPSTPHLTTMCANLEGPLVRGASSTLPPQLCGVHTWLNPKYLLELAELIAKELHYRSARLFQYPKESLSKEVKDILGAVWPYRVVFKPRFVDDTDVELIKTPADAFKRGPSNCGQDCIACNLSALFQDTVAVKALATLCKGRKRHRYEWPELLAYLDPVIKGENDWWRRDFIKEGHAVRKVRRLTRVWRANGGLTGAPAAEADVQEVPIYYKATKATEMYSEKENEVLLSGKTIEGERALGCDDKSVYEEYLDYYGFDKVDEDRKYINGKRSDLPVV